MLLRHLKLLTEDYCQRPKDQASEPWRVSAMPHIDPRNFRIWGAGIIRAWVNWQILIFPILIASVHVSRGTIQEGHNWLAILQ